MPSYTNFVYMNIYNNWIISYRSMQRMSYYIYTLVCMLYSTIQLRRYAKLKNIKMIIVYTIINNIIHIIHSTIINNIKHIIYSTIINNILLSYISYIVYTIINNITHI